MWKILNCFCHVLCVVRNMSIRKFCDVYAWTKKKQILFKNKFSLGRNFVLSTKIFSLAELASAHETNVARKFIFVDVMMIMGKKYLSFFCGQKVYFWRRDVIVGKNTFLSTFFSWLEIFFLPTILICMNICADAT